MGGAQMDIGKIVLQDVLAPDLKVVFCGMAAGTRSARAGAYYAGTGNRFWGVMYQLGFITEQLLPFQYPKVLEYGLGLTDLVKGQYGGDDKVSVSILDRNRLERLIRYYEPRYLAFNGKTSAKRFLIMEHVEYGLQLQKIGLTEIFVLPSTSGAANGFWSIEPWQELFALIE